MLFGAVLTLIGLLAAWSAASTPVVATWFLMASLAFIWAAMRLLERRFLSPSARWSAGVVQIDTGRDFGTRVADRQPAEPGRPADPTDVMLNRAAQPQRAAEAGKQALRDPEEFYHPLVDRLPQPVFCKDREGRFIFVNREYCRLRGRRPEDILGKTDFDLHPPELAQKYREDDRRVMATGETFEATETHHPLGQKKTVAQVIKSPMYDSEGHVIGVQGIFWDITERQRIDEQIRKLSLAVEHSPSSILITDTSGNIEYVNPAFTRVTGYTPAEVEGRNIRIMKSGHTPLATYQDLWQTILAGGEWRGELLNRKKNGELYWESVSISPMLDAGGRITHFLAVREDRTTQKRAEEALRASEARYRAIVEDQTDLICRFLPDGTLTLANDAYCRYFSRGRDQLIGQTLMSLIQVEDRPRLAQQLKAIGPGNPVATIEHRVILPSGEVRWQLWTNRAIFNDQGRLIEFQAVGQDITERKQADEALRQSEERFRFVAQATNDVVWDWNLLTDEVRWNASLQTVFGYSVEDVRSDIAWWMERIHPDDREHARASFQEAIDGGGSFWSSEYRYQRRDGSYADILDRGYVIHDDTGKPVRMIGAMMDITDRRRNEEELRQARDVAEAANRAKSEFLANMSHEIRTPMNGVIGMTGLLLGTPLTSEQREYVEAIRSSGDALLTIINDILDFSKIEAGRLELESQPFDLRECIEESLDLLAARAAEKGLELAYLVEEDVPALLAGDVTRVRQVLVNLIGNGIKFTQHGEVVVTARACLIDHDLYQIHCAVRDTGIGIPPDRMDRLFQSFSQVDASTTRKYGGTGLGLAICKRLVEMMGGQIGVESAPGAGSTFYFTFVAAPASNIRRARPFGDKLLAGKRLLIIDDLEINRRILSRQAQLWGMSALAADRGALALEWIRQGEPFDVAILDMNMPEMDGLTLAAEIRKHRDRESLPLVMLSSLGRREENLAELGFAAVLSKPIKPAQLHDALAGILSRSSAPARPTPVPVSLNTAPARQKPLRILLAEDNIVNQKVALRLLERMGYRADVAANGLEVLDALQRQVYDVVLMDVQMPEMDGYETSLRVRQQLPPARQPWIIAMTAHSMQGDRERCLVAGMDDYVGKPVRVEDLTLALERSMPATIGGDGASDGSLDRAVLDHLRATVNGQEMDVVTELIEIFLDDTPHQLEAMRAALAAGDPEHLRMAAHTLKSSSATLGALSLSALCAELEAMGREGTVQGAAEKVAQVEDEYARVQKAFQAEQAEQAVPTFASPS